jgi:hypothetical protein
MLFYGPTLGMVANMLEPRMRATGAALFGMLYTIIGSGLGPTFVGFVSDRFATTDFSGGNYRALCFGQHRSAPRAKPLMDMCSDAAAAGVGQALMTTVAVFFVASLCYLLAARTLRRDMFKLDMTNDRERR